MFKEKTKILKQMVFLFDLLLIVIAFFIGYYVRNDIKSIYPMSYYLNLLPLILVCWAFFLYSLGMYHELRLKSITEQILLVLKVGVVSYLVFTSTAYLMKLSDISRILITIVFALATLFILIHKIVLQLWLYRIRRRGLNYQDVIIVGTDERARQLINEIRRTPEFGLNIVGVIELGKQVASKSFESYRILGSMKDFYHIVKRVTCDQVFFVVNRQGLDKIEDAILHCETIGLSTHIAMDFFNMQFTMGRSQTVFGMPFLSFHTTSHDMLGLMIKRGLDVLVSLTALLLLWPSFIFISVLIKRTSPGPLFFRQKRCTLNGKKFTMYKFRTMVADAERKKRTLAAGNQVNGAAFKIDNDPRITPIGKVLRKYSLDELPQLWNVLRGDMSLVGPRPPLPREVKSYKAWQRRKLSMRTGLSCIWQTEGRSNITDFDEWMRMDLKYIDNWSLWLDLKIIFKTIPAVLFSTGAK